MLFAVVDAICTAVSFVAAYETRASLDGTLTEFYLLPLTVVILLGFSVVAWVGLGYWLWVYEHMNSAKLTKIVGDTLKQCLLGAVCVILFEFLLRLDLSRGFLIIFCFYNAILLSIFRLNSKRIAHAFQREFGKPYRVVIVGSSARAGRLKQELTGGSTAFRLEVSNIISEADCAVKLPALLEAEVIDEVIFAVDSQKLSELEETFLLCDEEGVRTRVSADFFPHVNSEMSLDRFGTAPLLTFSATPDDEARLIVKRCFDIVVALFALLVLAPLMLVIALLIRTTSSGPAIFRQTRCGLNGRKFIFYKFRSMVENAEELKRDLEHLNQKETAFKIRNDPRLTPIGRWLRKFSIDEWPQFFNILRGDMSVVGPRPAVPEEIENYLRWQRRRLRMRPGLTCLWAVRGRDHLDFETWMKLDLEYIDNWSLTLDLSIILRSIPYVLTGRGAH